MKSFASLETNQRTPSEKKLFQILKKTLSNNDIKNNHIQFQVKHEKDHMDVVVYLLSKKTFSFSSLKISLNKKFDVIDVVRPYHAVEFTQYATTNKTYCPDENVRFVIATACYDKVGYPNVPPAIDATYEAAVDKYGKDKVVALLNEDANQKNYQNYLSCPLDVFFSTGHSDGTQLYLYDGPTLASTFFQNNKLDLSKTSIVFDSCLAFSEFLPHGLCDAITPLKPLAYSSGISELLIYGSVETYAYFWQKVLRSGAPLSKDTLQASEIAWDPSVPNSQSPIYLSIDTVTNYNTNISALIQTTLRNYTFPQGASYLDLDSQEAISNIMLLLNQSFWVTCPPNKNISFIPGLRGVDYVIYYSEFGVTTPSCVIENGLGGFYQNETMFEDEYGFYPNDACQNGTEPPALIKAVVHEPKEKFQTSSASRTATSFLQTGFAYLGQLIGMVKDELKRHDLSYWTNQSMQTFFTTAALTAAAKAIPLLQQSQETIKLGY